MSTAQCHLRTDIQREKVRKHSKIPPTVRSIRVDKPGLTANRYKGRIDRQTDGLQVDTQKTDKPTSGQTHRQTLHFHLFGEKGEHALHPMLSR